MYEEATLEDMVAERLSGRSIPEPIRRHRADRASSMSERAQRFYQLFRDYGKPRDPNTRNGTALDVGCGTGASLCAMATDFDAVVGLDYELSALILAKKLVQLHEIDNVTLIQGTALNMPFCDDEFDFVNALNVLEHVFDLRSTLTEVHRTLRPQGTFVGDSRNRYDLFSPEPHVHLRWLGLLPRRWMPAYVRWRRRMTYDHVHLFSYGELHHVLRAVFGRHAQILLPPAVAYGAPAVVDSLVSLLKCLGPLHQVMVRIYPTHLVSATKAE